MIEKHHNSNIDVNVNLLIYQICLVKQRKSKLLGIGLIHVWKPSMRSFKCSFRWNVNSYTDPLITTKYKLEYYPWIVRLSEYHIYLKIFFSKHTQSENWLERSTYSFQSRLFQLLVILYK